MHFIEVKNKDNHMCVSVFYRETFGNFKQSPKAIKNYK